MKCLGILGGMSWESTQHYYQHINSGVRSRLGGLHSADLLIKSVDFAPIERWQAQDDWAQAADYLANCAVQLRTAGAEGLLIATNTMHKLAEPIEAKSGLPLLHIADCTARLLVQKGVKKVGLLGTAYTMEQAFYRQRLSDRFGLEVVVPDAQARALVHRVIYQELCLGQVRADSRQAYVAVTERLADAGAEAVILGCTEIGMLLTPAVTDVPLIDTTEVHAEAAVDWLLADA